ncbi:DNA internalization-related competence protein ComEC/Rec2 [Vibrio comitans]|nr:DNA internalization-related competence protein ComEC/Rec2 [Vibrio comitans]
MALLLGNWNLISFSATIVAAMYWHTLPELQWLVLILAMVLLCCRLKVLRIALGVLLASVVSLVQSHVFVRDVNTLFDCAENITINVELNSTFRSNLYFSNSIVNADQIYGCDTHFSGLLLLKVPIELAHNLKLGETWLVEASIRPIYGLLNEAGFDAERFYFGQRVIAQAKVSHLLQRTKKADLRGHWYNEVYQRTAQLESRPLILALLFGERSLIEHQLWNNLKQTGIAHLIAISGLHIGLAYMVGWWLGHVLRIAIPNWIWLPVFFAVVMATFYAWLAGFSLPTQRALVMCIVAASTLFLGIRLSRWRILWLTLAVVLTLSPMSAVSSSLWLSVGAVIIIFLAIEPHDNNAEQRTSQVATRYRKLRYWLRIQLYLSLGLAPMSARLLGGVAWLSIVFNAIAIPLVSLFVVPLLLAGIMLNPLSASVAMGLFHLSDMGLGLLVDLISMTQTHPNLWFQASQVQVVGLAILFALICVRRRWRILILCISGIWMMLVGLARDDETWRLDVLDVGHGLAVLIESDGRSIVYDTGAGWDEGSIAEMIVDPIVVQRGTGIDALFISHWDNDHQGGMNYLIARFLPRYVFTPQQDIKALPCMQGQFWWWQGLKFEIVWPPKRVSRAYNPHSCVLRISNGAHSVLLTGDIDAIAEYQLVDAIAQSDVIIVPHHGSNTSSTLALVDKVDAKIAIASVTKQGRWSLPNQEVVNRYRQSGARWLDTGSDGQVSVRFLSDELKVMTLRNPQTAAWYRQILRKGVE